MVKYQLHKQKKVNYFMNMFDKRIELLEGLALAVKLKDKTITKEEVEAMNKKINDSEEKALRASAELINYRKRKDEETEKILKYCNEDLVLEILPILDNFDRAMNIGNKEISDELNQYLNGMKMIQKGLIAALLKFEVKEIDSLDKKFDPKYHQAVMKESDPNKEKEIIL